MQNIARPMTFGATPATGAPASYPFRTLPLSIVMAYLIGVFVLFLVWPVDWPIYGAWAWTALIAYVALCFAAFGLCCLLGTVAPAGLPGLKPIPNLRLIIGAGAIAAVVLLFPSSYIYTGRWPWEIVAALQDQGQAYRSLYDQLLETSGQRGPIAAARALAGPLSFAALPLGILYWRSLNWTLRLLVVGAALSSIVLSIMRGTDREFFDLFLIMFSAFLVTVGRLDAAGGRAFALIKRYWIPALILLLLVSLAASFFNDRRSARLGGFDTRAYACANTSQICADTDAAAIRWMPLDARFSMSLFVLSSTSGFYGLSLGMEKDFRPTLGVGHSPAALSVYELMTGDTTARWRTYTARNTFDGWSDENYWSTLILWLANDLSFPGAVLAIAGIGFLYGRLWRDATLRRSDAAAVLFCLLTITVFYLPANNQVFATYEGYTTFLGWMVVWLMQAPARHPLSADPA